MTYKILGKKFLSFLINKLKGCDSFKQGLTGSVAKRYTNRGDSVKTVPTAANVPGLSSAVYKVPPGGMYPCITHIKSFTI